MRLIALEEHYRSRRVDAEIGEAGNYFRTTNSAGEKMAQDRLANLSELGERRIADMDRCGIDVQVLSHTHPSPEILEAARAIPLCSRVNDEIAEAVARYPTRFAGFATLPVDDPEAAAKELERAVRQLGFKGALINGMPRGRFLDDLFFTPILERAAALDVPLYLHPAPPPEAVRDAYFSGLEPGLARILSIAGWAWHAEQALHTAAIDGDRGVRPVSEPSDHHWPHGRNDSVLPGSDRYGGDAIHEGAEVDGGLFSQQRPHYDERNFYGASVCAVSRSGGCRPHSFLGGLSV